MTLHDKTWFINFITYLREHWAWFEKYGWGKSQNMEDFVRNSFEVLRDNCFPFVIKDVKPYSLLLRCGYIPYDKGLEDDYLLQIDEDMKGKVDLSKCVGTYHKHYDGKSLGFNIGKYRIIDLIASKWITKYPNAAFMFQILVSMKWKVIPILFVSAGLRYSRTKYFQFGLGHAPQWSQREEVINQENKIIDASLSAKLRIGDYEGELQWNPGAEVYGFWEGTV